jgi:hypothetical protein
VSAALDAHALGGTAIASLPMRDGVRIAASGPWRAAGLDGVGVDAAGLEWELRHWVVAGRALGWADRRRSQRRARSGRRRSTGRRLCGDKKEPYSRGPTAKPVSR